jgi:hypothetical protein
MPPCWRTKENARSAATIFFINGKRAMKPKQAPAPAFRPGRHFEVLDEPVSDPYQLREKLVEPSVCPDCGAVYQQGRWQWSAAPKNAHLARCTACLRIKENLPAGYVSLGGMFVQSHRDEILGLVRHLEAREKSEHPLQRIMAIADQDDGLLITTTDIHLASGIGRALQSAYHGELDFHYNKDEYLLRMDWRR